MKESQLISKLWNLFLDLVETPMNFGLLWLRRPTQSCTVAMKILFQDMSMKVFRSLLDTSLRKFFWKTRNQESSPIKQLCKIITAQTGFGNFYLREEKTIVLWDAALTEMARAENWFSMVNLADWFLTMRMELVTLSSSMIPLKRIKL